MILSGTMSIINSWHSSIIRRDEDTEEDYPLLRHYEKEDSLEAVKIKRLAKTKCF